ncbi:MAG: hypothetical protein J5852_03115, partial [Clostridia bacterium]|nr:hypothetical protein [Clostridia bacterium]
LGKIKKTALTVILSALTFVSLLIIDIFALKVSSIILLVACAVIGAAVFLIGKAGKAGDKK